MPSKTKAIASTSEKLPPGRNRDARIEIREVAANELDAVRALFLEYERFIGTDLCFQNFRMELAQLPGAYAGPEGCLLVAWSGDNAAGCVAVKPLEGTICEMKRLFVRPEFQGTGLGRRLAESIIERARAIGYREMRLDTLPSLKAAVGLYESLSFARMAAYHNYENKEIVFMRLALAR